MCASYCKYQSAEFHLTVWHKVQLSVAEVCLATSVSLYYLFIIIYKIVKQLSYRNLELSVLQDYSTLRIYNAC
jgi:hypothetical protein